MNTTCTRPPASPDWRRLVNLVRWFFILLLVVDLIGSPFHDHQHEGHTGGFSALTTQHVVDDSIQPHHAILDEDADLAPQSHDRQSGGHSLTVIRSFEGLQSLLTAPIQPQLLGVVLVIASLLAAPPTNDLVMWRPDSSRPPVSLFRTVPPDGRAPPVFSA